MPWDLSVIVGVGVAHAAPPDTLQEQTLPDRSPVIWTADDVRAAQAAASPIVACIIRSEVEGTGYNAYAIGAQGELGPLQLHPQGLLPEYERWSEGRSPFNPFLSTAYAEWVIEQGRASNWSAVKLGRC